MGTVIAYINFFAANQVLVYFSHLSDYVSTVNLTIAVSFFSFVLFPIMLMYNSNFAKNTMFLVYSILSVDSLIKLNFVFNGSFVDIFIVLGKVALIMIVTVFLLVGIYYIQKGLENYNKTKNYSITEERRET